MDRKAQHKAKQRVERINTFRLEQAQLEQEHALTLTTEQKTSLNVHYDHLIADLTTQFDLDVTESGKRISWGMRITSLLGGAALCAALVLFLHRIWGTLPTTAHSLILLVIPLLFLATAEVLSSFGIDWFYTTLLVLASAVGFVMEMNASGSIFNMVPSVHTFLVWGSFIMLLIAVVLIMSAPFSLNPMEVDWAQSRPTADAWMVCAWVKCSDTATPILFSFGGNYSCIKLQNGGKGKPMIHLGQTNYRYFSATAWTTLKDGQWHHVAFSVPDKGQTDISQAKMYLDGVSVAGDTAVTTGPQTNKSHVYLGAIPAVGTQWFGGAMDDLILFNRVLTENKIRRVMNREP